MRGFTSTKLAFFALAFVLSAASVTKSMEIEWVTTWPVEDSQGNSINPFIWSLAVDPGNPEVVYAGVHASSVKIGGVWKGTLENGVVTWEPNGYYAGLPDEGGPGKSSIVTALAADPEDGTLYAGTNRSGVWSRKPGDPSWSEFRSGLPQSGADYKIITALVVDHAPGNAATVYAGTWTSGLYKTYK